MPPLQAGTGVDQLAGSPRPIRNAKSLSLQQLDNGYYVSMQKVDDYGGTNDVAVDLDAALERAKNYFQN
jgi:hypothetical protein